MLKLGEASDLILEVFGVNEFHSPSLDKISFIFKGVNIVIWNDDGLHTLLVGKANTSKAFFLSIAGNMMGLKLMDSAYQLNDLKPALIHLKQKIQDIASLLRDPNIEKRYKDKSGFDALEL